MASLKNFFGSIIRDWLEVNANNLIGNCTLGGQVIMTAACLGQAICAAADGFVAPNPISKSLNYGSAGLYLSASVVYGTSTVCAVICPPAVAVTASVGYGLRTGAKHLDKMLEITDITKGV